MIDFEYAGRHVRGVWRLAFKTGDWREDIDCTIDGVFNSFWAAAFCAPPALLAALTAQRAAVAAAAESGADPLPLTAPAFAAAQFLSLYAIWALSLMLIVATARHADRSRQTAAAIVAFNWAQLLGYLIFLAPVAAFLATGGVDAYRLAAAPVAFANLYILWRIFRDALTIGTGLSISLVCALVVVEIFASTMILTLCAILFPIQS